ncbi:MAG: histidinol-phosphate transaminase [Promethearchaeati archaeon SRVP18_Atabeyarchaeia-1]
MGDVSRFFKAHVKEVEPYNPTGILRVLYKDRSHFARMMGNESPFPPSPRVKEAMNSVFSQLGWYPDSTYFELREALSKYTGLQTGNIIVANGSTELIDLISRAFIETGDEAILSIPTYSVYRMRLRVAGASIIDVPKLKPDFKYDVEGVSSRVNPRTRIIVLVRPDNPIGNLIPEDDVVKVLDSGAVVVLDEAYYEFCGKSLTKLIERYDNLIILRTLSKAFSLAGLRVGYALTNNKIVKYLERARPAFTVSLLAEKAAVAALGDLAYSRSNIQKIIEGREFLLRELSKIRGLRVYPSETNFILVKMENSKLPVGKIMMGLVSRGIIVRDYTDAKGLQGEYLRITVSTVEDNANFIKGIHELLEV